MFELDITVGLKSYIVVLKRQASDTMLRASAFWACVATD